VVIIDGFGESVTSEAAVLRRLFKIT
jgi:hypothetical protein